MGVAQPLADPVDLIIKYMPDAAVVVDRDGRIVTANASAELAFRYGPDELRGVALEALIPERFRRRHSVHRDTYAANPSRRTMGTGLDLWGLRKDGSEFPVDISLVSIAGVDGPVTVAAVRDLTGRRAEWQAKAQLASIVESSDDAIISMDLECTLTSWNPGAKRVLGYDADEMIGRSYFMLVPEQGQAATALKMAELKAGRHMISVDTYLLRKDGTSLEVSETLSVIPGLDGQLLGYSSVIRDITPRKRGEAELRRLLTEGQRRERWLAAISEIRLALFAGADFDEWLDLIAHRVTALLHTQGCLIVLPSDREHHLKVAAKEGHYPAQAGDYFRADNTLAGRVLITGRSIVSSDLTKDTLSLVGTRSPADLGPAVLAPVTTSHGVGGVLIAMRAPEQPPFGEEDIRTMESLAQQTGVGMEVVSAQADQAQLALVADRERIARDLHDHVIQRLFAVGMALQSAANSASDAQMTEKIESSVEELDATIRDVRSTIFSLELQATERVETSVRSRILDVASAATPALGFQPHLRFEGPIDVLVPEEMVPDIVAVVREGLSNVARHALATLVDVQVTVGDQVLIVVVDDGRGIGKTQRRSGLANLQVRAEERGGKMMIGPANTPRRIGQRNAVGVRMEWRVPLTARSSQTAP